MRTLHEGKYYSYSPEGDDERIALEHTQLQARSPIIEVSHPHSTFTSLCQSLLHSPTTVEAIRHLPDILDGFVSASKRYALHGNATLVLRARDGEIFHITVQCARQVCKSILGVSVRLLECEVDVWRVIPSLCSPSLR